MEREREDSNEDLRESVCMAKHSEGERLQRQHLGHTLRRESKALLPPSLLFFSALALLLLSLVHQTS